MTALKFVMTILNICDGDEHPNIRHEYTIQNMIDFYKIIELGTNDAEITYFDLESR